MRTLLVLLLLAIIAALLMSGCSGATVKYDSEGRPYHIKQSGIFPVKAKLGDCEIDTRLNILDINLSGVKA